jgi:hypothetical protein
VNVLAWLVLILVGCAPTAISILARRRCRGCVCREACATVRLCDEDEF